MSDHPLLTPSTRLKVSSVLNKDPQFGKGNLVDGNDETCWCSDSGSPQSVLIGLPAARDLTHVTLTFQGGFAGKECSVMAVKDEDGATMAHVCDFFPADGNHAQTFACAVTNVKRVKVVFTSSTDFFGRITVYALQLHGRPHLA